MPKLTLVFALAVASLSWSPCAFAQAKPQTQQDLQKLLGPNTFVFSPSTPAAEMQAQIDKVYAEQEHAEFGSSRYAFLFLPGDYHVDLPVGFYTEAIGLGAAPGAVHLTGNMHADASLPHNNATCTFWRAAEGLTVTPSTGTLQWATSQAISFRRMHVLGNMVLHQNHGWASGGWISDSIIDGNVDSGTQQQWISRNTEWHSWTGTNWNMVFVGVTNPPPGNWPRPRLHQDRPHTHLARKAVPLRRLAQQSQRPRSRAPARHRRCHLAQRLHARPHRSALALLHRSSR